MSRKLRILIMAEAANPQWPSVPLVGWSHAAALAELTDAHLVTHVRNRAAIAAAGWREGEQFTAIDSEAVARPLHRISEMLRGKGKAWTVATAAKAVQNLYFERLVWKQFGEALRRGDYDLVHRLTPLSPTAPSPMATHCRRIGVPYVIGPLNGGLPWPREFDAARRAEGEWLSYVRSVYKLMPGYHATRRDASLILVGSRATWNQMPVRYLDKCVHMPENGLDLSRFRVTRTRCAERPIRAAFVGRLVPYKGADMLFDAAEPLLRDGAMTLSVIGDGPLRESLEARALPGVTFKGWVEHTDVQHHLAEADLLTFPSVREFGGGVVLEAMAVGALPVIVDYGGPAELVTPDTAVTIPLGSRNEITTNLRRALRDLIANPSLIDQRGDAARRYARTHHTWSAKARTVVDLYHSVLSENEATLAVQQSFDVWNAISR